MRRTRSQPNENESEIYLPPKETPVKQIPKSTPKKHVKLEQSTITISSGKRVGFTPRSVYESGVSVRSVKSGISSLLEETWTFSEEIEQPRDIKISVIDDQRVVNDMSNLRRLCSENQIPQHFAKLVIKCRKAANRFIPESEVLVSLIKNHGKVAETINFYKSEI